MSLQHLAIIPDRNRHWARLHNLSYAEGYRAAADKMLEVVEWCFLDNISHLSAFVLSKNNTLKRPDDQLVSIHQAAVYFLREAYNLGVNIRLFGDIETLAPEFGRDEFLSLRRRNRPGARLTFYGLVNHSRTDDVSGVPDVDLLFRTGNTPWLDGFLPMQVADAVLKFWPGYFQDFQRKDWLEVLAWYQSFHRMRGA